MAKFVCKVCGYIHEGDSAPERCPQCKVPADKFEKVEEKIETQPKEVPTQEIKAEEIRELAAEIYRPEKLVTLIYRNH